MLKKITAILMAFCLLFGVTACAGGSSKKVTLKWAISWAGQTDDAVVLAEVNKRLETLLPGVSLEFVPFSAEKWTQQMAAGEKIDIAWTGYTLDMDSEIANGSYSKLNDLITEATTPNLFKEWSEYASDYNSATVDGNLYAIPNQQPLISESPMLKIPAELMKYFDVDAFTKATYASPTTTRDVYNVLDKYFKAIYAADAVDTDTVGKSIDIQNLYNYLAARGYTNIGSSTEVCYKTFNDGKVDLVNFATTDEYKLFMEYAVKWFKDGYISKDVLVSGGGTGSRLSPLTAHLNGMWYKIDDKRGIRNVYDSDGEIEQYYLNIEPEDLSHKALGPSVLGSEATYCAIPYTAEHPKEAIKLLDLLRSPIGTEGNDVLNLLVYGIEGTHYTLEGKDLAIGKGYTLQPDNSAIYGKPHWVVGNVFLTYRTPNILEGQAEYAKEYETDRLMKCYKTPLYNFRCNVANVKTQISNVKSATTEFNNRLICGVDGDAYMSTYDSYIAKLQAGGMDTIIAEIKSQADAYIAAQK